MKILIESYNNITQNTSGGIQVRIKKIREKLVEKGIEVKLFDKWNDTITDYDLLHIFKLSIDDYNLISLAKKNNIPIVISAIIPIQNSFKIRGNILLSKIFPINTVYILFKKMLEMSDVIIVQSTRELIFLEKNYKIDTKKIRVISNGIDTNKINLENHLVKEKLNIKEDFILQVGRFDSNKNQLNLIRALSKTSIPVVFIGGPDSGNSSYYKKCIEEATENIYFLGWLDHDSPLLSSAYKEAKVVVVPSLNETFGNVIIEGGLAGANLAVTETLPILETGLRNYCNTFDPSDLDSIRNSVLQAYTSLKTDVLKEFIEENFSWDKIAQQHIDLYKNFIN